ncbi:MAG: hypothetical protein SFY80_08425 [Verrucomicrobiota bacterium]|nr:hypothetical protein [Verrucomicrobiota bacterium]
MMQSSLLRNGLVLITFMVLLAMPGTATAGVWWLNNTTPSDNWTAVTYGKSRFVAVGSNGKITTSDDGVRFIERKAGVKLAYRDIAYGGGTFLALGRDIAAQKDYVLSSPDGITWTDATATYKPVAFASTVLYENNKFVIPNVSDVRSAAYGAGLYVAIITKNRTTALYTSVDGSSFLFLKEIEDEALAVHFNGFMFVMVGVHRDENYKPFPVTWTSMDGVTWPAASPIADAKGNLTDIAYFGGVYYTVGNGIDAPSNIFSSVDGKTWTREFTAAIQSYDLSDIVYGDGGYVAVGSGVVVTTFDVPEFESLWRYDYKQMEYTAGLKETSIGWIYDLHYPFVFSFNINAWLWVYPGSTKESLYAFAFTEKPHWIWTNTSGWYYNFEPATPGYLSW